MLLAHLAVERDEVVVIAEQAVQFVADDAVPVAELALREPGPDAWPLADRLAAGDVQVFRLCDDDVTVGFGPGLKADALRIGTCGHVCEPR